MNLFLICCRRALQLRHGMMKIWVAPSGEPNAGKSSTYQFVKYAFVAFIKAHEHMFPFLSPIYGAGKTSGFNEVMRNTNGNGLLIGPEAKAILDPKYPPTQSIDHSYSIKHRELQALRVHSETTKISRGCRTHCP